MVVVEGSPLVPSIVIYSHQHEKWLFGEEAAEYRPTPEDRVFSNWKASLYSQQLNQKVDGDMDAASKFFEWLGKQLHQTGIPVKQSKVKICLPAFDGAAEPGRMLVERMKRCGWAGLEHSTIDEPRANTVGIFGEGANSAHRPEPTGEIYPYYMRNFPMGGFVLNHLRNHALTQGPRFVSYLIIDIGSFTTDLSFAILDAQQDGDCVQQATQHSFELGLVEHYEQPLFNTLLHLKGLQWNDLNFNQRERIKSTLNSDAILPIPTPTRGIVTFGTSEDRDVARALAEGFSQQLATVIQRFMHGQTVRHVILTGGGVAIGRLRATLQDHLETQGIRVLDNGDPEAPEAKLEKQVASTVYWQETGENLERLATALGASSVLMDLPVHNPPPPEAPSQISESPWVVCSCNGGNKDCVTCGGLGMYRRSDD